MALLPSFVDEYTSIETWLYTSIFESNVLHLVLASFVWHWILCAASYFLLARFSENFRAKPFDHRIYWTSTLIAAIHAGITGFGVLPFIGRYWSSVDHVCARSVLVDFYDVYASGYFAYDFVLMVVMTLTTKHPGFRDPYFWAHHIFGIAIFPFLPANHTAWVASIFLVQEVTGPFTNGRTLLSYHGYRHTNLYLINGIVMVLLFTVVRILLPMVFWYRVVTEWTSLTTYNSPGLIMFATTGALLSLFLNTTWYFLMVKGLVKLLRGQKVVVKDEAFADKVQTKQD
eukprot:TRINITY_DN9425_c0_g1_i3.p1 TRINITY_DN9425_c0_g1~~TRINITY_DN9425_c0_g1_i3.p1  ORF type:complete len:308 (+),score=55.39 TRINITY_DN9425_c0_g1_i3:67-924(+)